MKIYRSQNEDKFLRQIPEMESVFVLLTGLIELSFWRKIWGRNPDFMGRVFSVVEV